MHPARCSCRPELHAFVTPESHWREGAFTLIELLAVIAIMAALATAASFFVVSYASWSKQVADQRSLLTLQDALNRYKCEGGDITALTATAPISHVLAKLVAPINWGGTTHQVMQAGFTCSARSLSATGNGQQYCFTRFNTCNSDGSVSNFTQSYLNLPGTSGAFASTPDSVPLSITGDIDIRAKIASTVWAKGSIQTVIAKWGTSYLLYLDPAGKPWLFWSTDGIAGNAKSALASTAVPVPNGVPITIRACLDVDNGAGGWTVTFYTTADGVTWVQLGTPVSGAGVTSIIDTAAMCYVGSLGASNNFTGSIYKIEIRNGINGTIVASPDFTIQIPGIRTFTDAQGNTWTVNGSASIMGP